MTDIHVLCGLARRSHHVLEFGAGGSTTIWAQFCPPGAEIMSVEAVPEWHQRTTEMLHRLGVPSGRVRQIPFDGGGKGPGWKGHVTAGAWFDLIFIDHHADRIAVAEESWDLLMPGGIMAWHDCHWPVWGKKVLEFLATKWLEVSDVHSESAVTYATKCVERCIKNTDAFEERAAWESGHAPLPAEWPPARIK